ncbi:hypothetical protein K502DRAFT_350840 [Neoconidiobolus thromboides FSU 785]|nr:hypothetical protein K502DRAFT_350840 [Neoconidiobolus thromboides FSU 785]
MSLKFEYLSEILLEDVFKLLHPEELFRLRYLSKYLSKVIEKTIEYNLTYSIYDEFERCQNYQENFIRKNGLLVKHMNVNYKNINYLSHCSNLQSIRYDDTFNNNNIKIVNSIPKLRKVVINSKDCRSALELFRPYLSQIESFEINTGNITISEVIKYLNPDVLKSFKISGSGRFCFDGLDTIKSMFTNLKFLCLRSNNCFDTSGVDPGVNFNTNLNLEIEGRFKSERDIVCFGNLKQLKDISVLDVSRYNVNIMGLINISRTVDLTTPILSHLISADCLELPIRKATIDILTKELLNTLSRLSSIQTIYFEELHLNIHQIFGDTYLTEGNLRSEKYNSIRCSFVKRIEINHFSHPFIILLFLVSLFPNLEIVKINDFKVVNTNRIINYKLNTPLLLIAPITPGTDIGFYKRIENIPMLGWMKI